MTGPLVDAGTALDPYEFASAVVRDYCKQEFTFQAGDVVLIDPRPNRTAQLPEMPVTAVTLVEAYMPDGNGVWGWQTLSHPGQYGWSTRGLVWDATQVRPPIDPGLSPAWPMYTWPWLPETLRVTYSHGFATIPADVQAITLRLAATYAANPTFVQSKKVGEVATVFGVGGIAMLRPEERKILDRYAVQEV